MDIPALSMAMSQAKVMESASLAVMKMSLENMEQVEEQLAQLIEGSTVDVSV